MAINITKRSSADLSKGRLLLIDSADFRANYNERPFMFQHRLNEHPLMQIDALVDLANRLPADQVRHSRGKRSLDVDFDDDLRARRHRLTLDQVLSDMRNADAYVLLHRPDTDPAYRDLLLTALGELRELSEGVDPGMCDEAAYIFIASPGAVTPYHMDREVNFHCQVRGSKTYRLWDQHDTSLLNEQQIETLFAREDLPKPGWQPEYELKGTTFDLTAGTGVQQPLLAPHAVAVGDEISIAIALTFRTRSIKRRIAIHCTNYKLRRLGLDPGAYGQTPLLDNLKVGGNRGFNKLRSFSPWRRRG